MNKILNTIFILPIKFYQGAISPLFGSTCRHQPTCSNYTIEAIQEWGALRGLWMGMVRLSSCHPWGKSGYNPVPKNTKKKHNVHH
jgi:putative membrane protein insertion efficiency factor